MYTSKKFGAARQILLAPAEGLLASLASLFASLTMSLISVANEGGAGRGIGTH